MIAKNNIKLIEFIKEFYQVTGIKTDPIYSGKLFYSLIDQLRTKSMFKNKTIIPVRAFHGKLPILGYRFADFAYLTDVKIIEDTPSFSNRMATSLRSNSE